MKNITDTKIKSFLQETLEDLHNFNYQDFRILDNCQEDSLRQYESRSLLRKIFLFSFHQFVSKMCDKGYRFESHQINLAVNFIWQAF